MMWFWALTFVPSEFKDPIGDNCALNEEKIDIDTTSNIAFSIKIFILPLPDPKDPFYSGFLD